MKTQRNYFIVYSQHRLNDAILLAAKIVHNNLVVKFV